MDSFTKAIESLGKYYPYKNVTRPIAEDIVKVLVNKKISYAEASEALDIAKELIKALTLSF